jgi:hypothetical protein
MVAQIFRSRSDWTMQAFGENGYVQTSEGGNSVGFGPVMVHNFLVNFSVTDNLRPFLEDISDEEFEEILVHLHDIHGTEGNKSASIDLQGTRPCDTSFGTCARCGRGLSGLGTICKQD